MCGIAGIIRFDGKPVQAGDLAAACAALRHRGPDHAGHWLDRAGGITIGLAATRLVIRDLSAAANQPMHDAAGRFVLVYNGELYNHDELRRELESAGAVFRTRGDTEVVMQACARWGSEALNRFNGMWALAFFDRRECHGFVARDRFGIKPLLYAATPGGWCFASELAALGAFAGWDRTVDDNAVTQLLQFGSIAAPATIHRGARRLPPGCRISFSAGGVEAPRRFFSLESLSPERQSAIRNPQSAMAPVTDHAPSYADCVVRLRDALRRAVVCRRVSDVPIGAFLSGGLDSSIIVAHLSEAMGAGVETFSVGHADQPAYDESAFARLAAARFGTRHHELKYTDREILDAIPSILDHLSEPSGDSSIIPTTLVSRYARRFVTVALSGDGGDELFGGYWRYLGHQAVDAYRRLPAWLRRGLLEPILARAAASRTSGGGNRVRQFRKLLRAAGSEPLARHVAWSRILAPEAEDIFDDPRRAAALDESILQIARALSSTQPSTLSTQHSALFTLHSSLPLTDILRFDLQYGLPSDMLHKVDIASMSCSLEVRVPFLDPAVVACALHIPTPYKIDRGLGKRILIDAYRGLIPDEILDRPKKGFEVPFGEYLRGPLRDMFLDVVTPNALATFPGLCHSAVTRLYDDHCQRRHDHADVLFALLSLCWWAGR